MNTISREKLLGLIEPHHHKHLIESEYKVLGLDASELLTSDRLDLAFKLLYIDLKDVSTNYANALYREHLSAMNLGCFIEPGNKDKNSLKKYQEEFFSIYESIKNSGFNIESSIVPLSNSGSILNGSHRVASAISLKSEVGCIHLNLPTDIYNYKLFKNRAIPKSMLKHAVNKYIEYAENVYIAFVWPSAQGFDDELDELIQNVIYKESIYLTKNGAHNLLSQIYKGETWLGKQENNYNGVIGKLSACFKYDKPVRVFAFNAKNFDEVLKLKESVREIFKLGKHSIHITDTKEEAVAISNMVFNDNGVHFLNYAKPNKYTDAQSKIEKFKTFVSDNKLNIEDFTLDSGMVLSVYGLRESSDIDYFSSNEVAENINEAIDNHDGELVYHKKEKVELIYNPELYFIYQGVKFVAFDQVYKMKLNRAEQKDINDCRMMESMINNNFIDIYRLRLNQKFVYTKIKLKIYLVQTLKKLNLYESVRYIYRFFKR